MSTRTLSATAVVVAILALIVARLDLPVGEPSSAIAAPSAPPDPPAIFAVGAQVQYSHEFPEKGNVWDTDSENPQNLIVGASIEIPDFHDVNSHWSVDLAPDHIRITYTAAMQGAALGAFNGHHIKDSLGTLPPFPKLKLGAETTLKAVEVTQGPDNIYINLAGVVLLGCRRDRSSNW